jgi:hypothetical protein
MQWKLLVYFTAIWYILCSFGKYIFCFGVVYQEESGRPGAASAKKRGCEAVRGHGI